MNQYVSRIQAVARGYITRTILCALLSNRRPIKNIPINKIDPVYQTLIPDGIGTIWIQEGYCIFQFPLQTLIQLSDNPFTRTKFDKEEVLKRIRTLFRLRYLPVVRPICDYIQWPVMHPNGRERIPSAATKRLLFPRRKIKI